MASILADKTESKLTISFAYNKTFIKDVITLSDSTFTLEQTALPLTGNITYHTHDTTYAAQEPETDVWDGATVSTSWSGSGTKEDPFLIQSCADYIYFLIGKIDATMSDGNFTSADMKYVKITKNLDFDNKEIPTVQLTTSDPDFYKYLRGYILLDGNGCVVKNFSVEMPSNLGDNYTAPIWYLPLMAPAFVHDINFVGIKWKIPLGTNEEVLSTLTYTSFANVVFDLTIETTGEYSAITVLPVVYNYFSIPGIETEIPIAQVYQDYVAEKGCFFGIDIKTQSIPQNGLGVYIQCQNPISGYDMSLYNWEGGNFDGSSIGQNMTLVIKSDYGDFRLSTLSSGKFIHQSFGGDDTTVIDAEVISPEDLKSQSYINEINSSNPVLTLNSNYNLPLIASLQVSYNGYVKKSVFDALGVKVDDINKKILAFLDISSILRLDESYSSEAISEFISWYNNAISNLNISRYKVFHYVVEDDGLIPVSVTGDGPSYSFAWVNGKVHVYKYIRREGSTFTITVKINDLIDREEVLVKDNTLAYTPTADYHPATKKYVDNKSNLKNADYTICFENNTRDNPFSPDANADSLVIAGNITSEYSLNYLQPALNNRNNRYYRVRLSDGPITDGNGGDVVGLLEFLQTDSNNGSFLIHMFRGAVVSHMRGYIDISNNSYYAASFG